MRFFFFPSFPPPSPRFFVCLLPLFRRPLMDRPRSADLFPPPPPFPTLLSPHPDEKQEAQARELSPLFFSPVKACSSLLLFSFLMDSFISQGRKTGRGERLSPFLFLRCFSSFSWRWERRKKKNVSPSSFFLFFSLLFHDIRACFLAFSFFRSTIALVRSGGRA